jgi:hypothetical protein
MAFLFPLNLRSPHAMSKFLGGWHATGRLAEGEPSPGALRARSERLASTLFRGKEERPHKAGVSQRQGITIEEVNLTPMSPILLKKTIRHTKAP